jgi:hypothetical protein
LREVILHQSAKLRVVSPKAGIVFEDNAIDDPSFYVPDHVLIAGAVEGASAVSIVRVYRYRRDVFSLPPKIFEMVLVDLMLVLYTVAFRLIPVLFAETVRVPAPAAGPLVLAFLPLQSPYSVRPAAWLLSG